MFNRFKRGVLACALLASSMLAMAAAVSTVTPPNLSGGLAGTIPGQSSVSSRGASQYSFPIAVPPGTAGMAPSLGLSYDSENPIDIGGVGWSLSGLSQITRCKRTLATDNLVHAVDLTSADAYCLNGERLIKISGTDGAAAEYRTEVESFQRVKSFGSNTTVGPDHWTVETRDGRIMTIGGVWGSTVSATKTGTTTTVNWMWKLQQVQDQHGNYMTYAYETGTTGEAYPTWILYTGNTAAGLTPYNAVEFVYQARNDVFSGFVSEAPVKRPNRLAQIRTHINVSPDGNGGAVGGTVARQWNFAYTYSPYSNRSLLQSVTDCSGDGSQCLPPTTFAWTQRDSTKNTFQASTGTWNGPGITLQSPYLVNNANYYADAQFAKRAIVADFNGDGKSDLLTNAAGSSTWTLCQGGLPSANCTSLPGMPAISSENFILGDFNGDGLPDVLVPAGGSTWYLCLSIGTGFSCSQVTGLPSWTQYINTQLTPLVGDFNGDGRDDVLFSGTLCASTGSGFSCRAYNTALDGMFATPSNAPGENVMPASHITGDFDGDGQIDILAYQTSSNDQTCHTTPTNNCVQDSTQFWRYIFGPTGLIGTANGNTNTGAYFAGLVTDLNGDGVTDLIFKGEKVRHNANTGAVISTNYYLNTCFGGTICTATSDTSTDPLANFQGGGDLLQAGGAAAGIVAESGGTYLVVFNADGTPGAVNTSIPWTMAPFCMGQILRMDLDGDGINDSLYYTPSSLPSSSTGTWTYSLSGSNSFSDRLQSVTDGNGLTTKWTYTSGNDSTVVATGTRGTYPTKSVRISTPVVSKMSVDADSVQTAGKTLDTTYTYSGMRMDGRGRGSLGFDTVKSTDVATGIVTTTQYSQVFPTIASVTSVTKVGGGVTLHSEVSTWASLSTQSGLNVLYPYVRTKVTTGQDLDGTWLPQTTMQVGTSGGTDGIDAYGNITASTTKSVENNGAGDVYQVSSQCTQFENRVISSQWILGLCDAASQSATSPSAGAITRQSSSIYDTFGKLTSTTSMPSTGLALTTAYTLDPNTGVPTVVTKTWTDPLGLGGVTPTSSMTYDSNWRFPVAAKNALGQVETYSYDAATGAQTSVIDYNNLTTSWKVDAWGRKTEEDRPDGTYSTLAYRLCVNTCGSYATHVDIAQHWAPGAVQMLAPEETLYDSRGRKLLYRTWNDASTEADITWSYGDMGDLYMQTLPKYASDANTGVTTNSVIDILHRPKQVDSTNAQGTGLNTTRYSYSALTTTITDANLHTRTELLNALGKGKKVTDNNGQTVAYAYDGFGDLLSTTDAAGNVVSMGYDVMGHKTSMHDPDLGAWTYVVDAAGRTRQQTDAKNQVSTYLYDLLNRPTQRIEADQESDWLYDSSAYGVGKIAEAYTKNQSGTRDYDRVHHYDVLSRETQVTLSLDWDYTTLTTYNSYGMPATVTHRRNTIGQTDSTAQVVHTLGYNVRGAVNSVQRDGATVWTLNYDDAAGRKRQETLGNGLVVAHGYNVYTALLESINTGTDNGTHGATPTVQGDIYTYDPVGNLLTRSSWANDGGTLTAETFTYDPLDRLSTSTVAGQAQQAFGYDALGNVVSKAGVGTYSYNAAGTPRIHLVASISGSVAGLVNPVFTYDNNGNLLNGLNRYYTWTASNLPATIDRLTGSGVPAGSYPQGSNLRYTFSYGPERDRTKQTIQVVAGGAPTSMNSQMFTAEGIEKEIDFRNNLTMIRTYLPGGIGFTEEVIPGTAIAATATAGRMDLYYLKDNLGSPEVIIDGSRTERQRMAYDAWGRRRNASGSENAWTSVDQSGLANQQDHKGFTDQEELDELSLVHLNGRVYDPLTSRFVSPDPTIPDPYDLQSLNRASYVRNSPMDKVDPTGFIDSDTYGTTGDGGTHGWDVVQAPANVTAYVGVGTVAADPKETKQTTNGSNPTGPVSNETNDSKDPNGTTAGKIGGVVRGMTPVLGSVDAFKEAIEDGHFVTAGVFGVAAMWEGVTLGVGSLVDAPLKALGRSLLKDAAEDGAEQLGKDGGAAFFRGARPGEAPSFVPRPNEFKVDPATGFVKDSHGVSVFDNPQSVSSKGFVPHQVDQSSLSDSLRIIQRGSDPRHFEIVPRPGANLTPEQFTHACSSIVCIK